MHNLQSLLALCIINLNSIGGGSRGQNGNSHIAYLVPLPCTSTNLIKYFYLNLHLYYSVNIAAMRLEQDFKESMEGCQQQNNSSEIASAPYYK